MKDHIKIAMAMKRYGGSFMKGIGEALLHADSDNAAKIKATWPQAWVQYADMASKMSIRDNTENDA